MWWSWHIQHGAFAIHFYSDASATALCQIFPTPVTSSTTTPIIKICYANQCICSLNHLYCWIIYTNAYHQSLILTLPRCGYPLQLDHQRPLVILDLVVPLIAAVIINIRALSPWRPKSMKIFVVHTFSSVYFYMARLQNANNITSRDTFIFNDILCHAFKYFNMVEVN